jgi:Mrp family chromosome partitioning ATPase
MLGRKRKIEVLAEIPANGASPRRGALGREQLDAYAGLAASLASTGSVLATGPAKSEVALGIAAAATAAGRRVVLVECDLAGPALAQILGLAERPGLHEYLRGDVDPGPILQQLVLAGPASSRAGEPLACIVAGEMEPAPVSLLDSERCDKAIEKLRRAYELLVIDGPPLSEDQDALRALSEHTGATLVCGTRSDIPKRPPVPVSGAVVVA